MVRRALNQNAAGVVVVLAGLTLAFGLIAVNLLPWAEVAARQRVPGMEMGADYFFALIWACVLGLSILVWPVSSRDRRVLLVLWLAKICVTLGIMLFYESRYKLDSFEYFRWAAHMKALEWSGPELFGGKGAQVVVALCTLQNYFLPFSFHALKVTFSMFGMLGVYFFYRGVVRFLGREDPRVLLALAFLPSILFWSSILGKDPLVLFGLGIYAYGVLSWHRTRRWAFLILVVMGLAFAAMVRVWLLPIFTGPLVVFGMKGLRRKTSRVILLMLVMAGFWFAMRETRQHFRLETTQDLVNQTNTLSRIWAYGGSAATLPEIDSVQDMVKLGPFVMFTALFRPLPGEVPHIFGWLAGVEDLGLLLLLALALMRIAECWPDLKDPVVLWALFTVLAWASVYGFVSAQNMGTAVRFRLQIMPFFWGLLLYLNRRRPKVPVGVIRAQKEKVYVRHNGIPQSSTTYPS
jgi:preprotein translocase subunit YajC